MIREDFIMRQVRLLTDALIRIVFLRQSGRVDEALTEVESSGKLVGARSGISLTRLDPEEIVSLATTKDCLHIDSALTLFDLLVQAADLYEMQQRPEDRNESAMRAVYVALAIFDSDATSGRVDLPEKLDRMVRTCGLSTLSESIIRRLLSFYESQAEYGRAEDMLFVLVDRNSEGVRDLGLSFFERLEQITPTRLRKGNLTLKEVREGRAQLLSELDPA